MSHKKTGFCLQQICNATRKSRDMYSKNKNLLKAVVRTVLWDLNKAEFEETGTFFANRTDTSLRTFVNKKVRIWKKLRPSSIQLLKLI